MKIRFGLFCFSSCAQFSCHISGNLSPNLKPRDIFRIYRTTALIWHQDCWNLMLFWRRYQLLTLWLRFYLPTCSTTPCTWSRCLPGKFFLAGWVKGGVIVSHPFVSTFLPEHSFMVKSYGVGSENVQAAMLNYPLSLILPPGNFLE